MASMQTANAADTKPFLDVKTFIGKSESGVAKVLGAPEKRGTDPELSNATVADYKLPKGVKELRAVYGNDKKKATWIIISVEGSSDSEEEVCKRIGLDISQAEKKRVFEDKLAHGYFDRFRILPKSCAPATALEINASYNNGPQPGVTYTGGYRPAPKGLAYSISVYSGEELAP
jgi:hypothetical protein